MKFDLLLKTLTFVITLKPDVGFLYSACVFLPRGTIFFFTVTLKVCIFLRKLTLVTTFKPEDVGILY